MCFAPEPETGGDHDHDHEHDHEDEEHDHEDEDDVLVCPDDFWMTVDNQAYLSMTSGII